MIVVDTNLLVYVLLPGDRTRQAEAAFARDPEWVAPLLWRSEFRNVLVGYMHRGTLSLEAALAVVHAAERRMTGREFTVSSSSVLALTAQSGCSAYDCEFLALAQDLRVKLVTVDRQILAAFPSAAVSLDAFIS